MPERGKTSGVTRRRFVRDPGVAAVTAGELLGAPARRGDD